MLHRLSPAVLLFAFVYGCTTAPGAVQHATVLLRDGTSVAGTVTSSSPTEIQITGDDKVAHRIPMNQVRSIEYDETPTAASTPVPSSAPSPGATATAGATPRPAPPRPGQARLAANPVHENHYHPVEAAITTKTHELPAGTEISVLNEETIDSSRATEGQTFAAEVTKDVLDTEGRVVIPRGANAQIVIRSASGGDRFHNRSDLVLDLASVSVDGRSYQLNTKDVARRGKEGVGANKRTAEYAGGGAAIGAVIGAITGGGKGAAIGAATGAGAGAAAEILTKGDAIKVPAETVLTFQLETPLKVEAKS